MKFKFFKIFKLNIFITFLVTLILSTPLLAFSFVEPRKYNNDELKQLAIREEVYQLNKYDEVAKEYIDIEQYFPFEDLNLTLNFLVNSSSYKTVELVDGDFGLSCDALTYEINNIEKLYFRETGTNNIVEFNLEQKDYFKSGYYISLTKFIETFFNQHELNNTIKDFLIKHAISIKISGNDRVFDKIFDIVYNKNIRIYNFKFKNNNILTSYNRVIKESALLIISILSLSVFVSLFLIINYRKIKDILYLRFNGYSLNRIKMNLFIIYVISGLVAMSLSLLFSYLLGLIIHIFNPLFIYEICFETLIYILTIFIIFVISNISSLILIRRKELFNLLREE